MTVTYVLGLILAAAVGAALAGRRRRPAPRANPILDNNTVGLAHIRDRRFIWANPRWAEILGLLPGHLTDVDVVTFHQDPAAYSAFGRLAYPMLARGQAFTGDVRLRRIDGTPFWGHLCGALLVPGQPEAGAIWTLEDVTLRVEAQEELAEQFALNLKLLAASATGIMLVRAVDGRCILANEAATRMLDETEQRLLETPVRQLESWRAAGLLEPVEAALAAPVPQRLEMSVAVPGPDQRWLDVQCVPFVSRGQRLLLVMMMDVSDRIQAGLELRRTEQAREQLVEELKQKNKELETLVYVASHDLRSPLVNIQGFSQRLGKALDELQRELAGSASPELLALLRERMPAALGYIRASGAKMDSIINGLLRLSRAGRMGLRTEVLDMDQLLQTAAGSMAYQLQSAEGELELQPLPPCRADPAQTAQVFANLLDNAIKYRDPARPLRVRVSGQPEGRMVCYSVEDNGIGIPPEQRSRVWEIFQRLDPAGPTPGEGLGLTLVRRMVERNGGRIQVESGADGGSRFLVLLPAV